MSWLIKIIIVIEAGTASINIVVIIALFSQSFKASSHPLSPDYLLGFEVPGVPIK